MKRVDATRLLPRLGLATLLAVSGAAAVVAMPASFDQMLAHVQSGATPQPKSNLRDGLDALRADRITDAVAIRDAMGVSSLPRHVLSWAIALYGGEQVPSKEIAETAKDLPSWPGMMVLRRNFERSLARENPAPAVVVKVFGPTAPQTIEGAILLARAQLALRNRDAARAALAATWRTESLELRDELIILGEFGAVLAVEDHRARMEAMLYQERVRSAERVAALAGAKPLADAWSAVIRNTRDARQLLDAVPAAMRSAGYVYAKAKFLREQNRLSDAAAELTKPAANAQPRVEPAAWWTERRLLARRLLDAGQPELAYKVAAAARPDSAVDTADAEFHAGWIALREMRDAALASRHFSRIAARGESPITLARAYYWLGRAAGAGAPGVATHFYAKSASYGTTFYGQLAAAKAGIATLDIVDPNPSGAERAAFAGREAVQAIDLLESAGYPSYAGRLYRDLAEQLTSAGELALLAAKAERNNNHYLALRIAKISAQRGIDVGALSHPIGVIPDSAAISGAGKALAYAIARQESEFNVGAVSGAGARGLLQLMPGTAEEAAKRSGLAYSQERLTNDPGYNATLGSSVLVQQLARFGGSYVLTFAAYNAGPRRADDWVRRYGDPRGKPLDEVVDWIERVPFAETRAYIQRVMENYQVYKMRLSGRFDIESDLVSGRKTLPN